MNARDELAKDRANQTRGPTAESETKKTTFGSQAVTAIIVGIVYGFRIRASESLLQNLCMLAPGDVLVFSTRSGGVP